MALLTRAQIDAVDDLPREEVTVTEWGGSVFVHTLTAGEVLGVARSGDGTDDGKFAFRTLALALRDDQGVRLFDGADGSVALEKRNPGVVLRLIRVCDRLNRLGDEAIENAAKN